MSLFSKRPLALSSFFFLLGSLFTYLASANGTEHLWVLLPFLLFSAVSLILLLCKRSPYSLLTAVLALSMLLGFAVQLIHHNRHFRPWEEADAGTLHRIVGTAVAVDDERSNQFTVKVTELDGERTDLLLSLRLDGEEPSLQPSDVFSCAVYMLSAYDPYDYSRGLAGSAAALEAPTVTASAPTSLASRLLDVRRLLSARFESHMAAEDAALLSAVFLGDREGLGERIETDFKRAGLSHILALSGLHLSILAGYLLHLLHRMRVPRAVTFPLVFLLLLTYTALTGFSYSLIRATVMLLIAELAALLRLIPDSVTSLFLSVAAINLFVPSAIADLGLWLSFLATLGILIANEILPGRKRKRIGARLLHAALFSVILSTFALVFTLFLSSYSFGAVSLLSPLTNLLITPLVHLLLLFAPLALLFPSLAGPPVGWCASLIRLAVDRLAALPGTYISVGYPLFLIVLFLFSLYLLFLLVGKLPKGGAFFRYTVPAFAAVCLVLLGAHLGEVSTPTLLYAQTYSSEALILRVERKTTVILNIEKAASADSLVRTLNAAHITEIDLLILPQYHEETAAGLSELSAKIPICRIAALPASAEEDALCRAAVKETADALGILWQEEDGTVASPAEELDIKILSDIPLSASDHTGFLLSASWKDTEIRYLSAGILHEFSKEDMNRFIGQAHFLILGSHPSGAQKAKALQIPADCTVIVGDTEKAPPDLFATHENAVSVTSSVRYRLR